MFLDSPLDWKPTLEDAIERHPLVVSPTTRLEDAIALISQAHHRACLLTEDLTPLETSANGTRASCVLVMQGQTLVGILTERDVVRLTAQSFTVAGATVADVMVHPVITLPQRSIQDVFASLFLFRRYRIRHLPILDEQGQVVGIISHESIRQILRPANLLRLRRVSDVMITQVIQAPLTATVLQLAQLMAAHHVSCVVITESDREGNALPVGIVTERDIVQFQAFQINLYRTQAQAVMSSPLFLLSPEDSLWTAHQEMQKRHVGRLVVSWNWGQCLGIVTQTSLLRVFDPLEMYGVIENLQQTIQQLQVERRLTPSLTSPSQIPLPTTTKLNQQEPLAIASSPPLENEASLPILLGSAQSTIQDLMADLERPIEQRQLQLQSVLDILATVNQVLCSPEPALPDLGCQEQPGIAS